MEAFIFTVNYIALGLLIVGLISVLKNNFRIRDFTFLIGTILLTLGAFLTWSLDQNFKIFAFVMLFGMQIVANILQIKSKKEKFNTNILLFISVSLFVIFFLEGLFQSALFFLIAFGTVITGIGYKEKPAHILRQSVLFVIGTTLELLFAFFTNQHFYTILNIVFLFFALIIMVKGLHKFSKGLVQRRPNSEL